MVIDQFAENDQGNIRKSMGAAEYSGVEKLPRCVGDRVYWSVFFEFRDDNLIFAYCTFYLALWLLL
jgi:hypothetical protein